jgi:AcrR family transcriptional regulator
VTSRRKARGRRPGPTTTREEIITAARASFAELGYDRTSMRGIAARAGVDPALVHRFFGSKDDLLAASLATAFQPERIPGLVAAGEGTMGERVMRYFLSVWEQSPSREVLVGLLRSAASSERAAAQLREFIGREVLGRVADEISGREDRQLRTTLMSSQLVGLAMLRYILRFEPLASMPQEALAAAIAPTLDRYLTGRLDLT